MPLTEEEMQRARQEVQQFGRVLTSAERTIRERRKALARFGKMFLTPDGKEFLAELQALYYDCDLFGRAEGGAIVDQITYANLGAREVVRYLMDLRDSAQKEQ